MTYHDQLEAGLLALGWQRITTKSGLGAFVRDNPKRLLFVGPGGSLRVGPNKSNSTAVGDPQHRTGFYLAVLEAGKPKTISEQLL